MANGAFTHLQKKNHNEVTGIDVSPVKIDEAKKRYPEIDFRVLSIEDLMGGKREYYDLLIMKEVLNWLKNPEEIIAYAGDTTRYLFVELRLIKNLPEVYKNASNASIINYLQTYRNIENADRLKEIVANKFNIKSSIILKDTVFIFAENRNPEIGPMD